MENDNLKRELSQHRGMRKYVTSQTPSDSGDMSKLKNAKSKMKSLTAQLQQTTNELLAIAADDAGDDTADDASVCRRHRALGYNVIATATTKQGATKQV